MEQVAPPQEWCPAALAPEKSITSSVSWVLPPAATLNASLKLRATVSELLCLHPVALAQVSAQAFESRHGKLELNLRLQAL